MKINMKYIGYLFICIFLWIFLLRSCSPTPIQPIEERIDTVIIRDTITINKLTPINKYITRYDTIVDTCFCIIDTDTIYKEIEVPIPIETKTYKDNDYYAVISGYKAQLDTLKIFPKETTIYKEKIEYKPIKKPFGVGVQIGGTYDGKVRPYVGVGISYNFLNF